MSKLTDVLHTITSKLLFHSEGLEQEFHTAIDEVEDDLKSLVQGDIEELKADVAKLKELFANSAAAQQTPEPAPVKTDPTTPVEPVPTAPVDSVPAAPEQGA